MLARHARRWAESAVLCMFLAGTPQAARAAEGSDQAAVQSVISRQLDAFKHDDAATAYGFAASGIRTKFPDAAGFLAMVKRAYKPVYRPRSIAFGEFKKADPGFSQSLTIIDSDGQAWTAFYSLERGPDGQLTITGCSLIKTPEVST